MAAGIKYDDGTSFISNCFPVRRMQRDNSEADGAWLVAYRAEQRRQFKAVICAKQPRTYSRLKEERRKTLVSSQHLENKGTDNDGEDENVLDGFYLLKRCCVEDPSDLCSVNISSNGLRIAKEDDFQLFDNVAYINAADNELKLEMFNSFPSVRELELPVNGLSELRLSHEMFRYLEMLDLSYNNLLPAGLLEIGYLRVLKVLYLTGNSLSTLPAKMAACYQTDKGSKEWRFPCLEILGLDHNELDHIQAFAPLAGLKRLRHLSLEYNKIACVPHLQARAVKGFAGKATAAEPTAGNITDSSDRHYSEMEHLSNQREPLTSEALELTASHTDNGEIRHASLRPAADSTAAEHQNDTNNGNAAFDAEEAVPFPELRFLSLAHNCVVAEEDVLPVAAWPALEELFLHGNPLTETRSGDPPLLKQFLQDEIGITVFRKKPVFEKPVFEVPLSKPSRKIKTVIPPIPRVNVDKLLALEGPKQEEEEANKSTAILQRSDYEATSKERTAPVTLITAPDETNTQPAAASASDHDTFFMTQVDDNDVNKPAADIGTGRPSSGSGVLAAEIRKSDTRYPKLEASLAVKFAGYEELLDHSDEDCLVNTQLPKDLSTSVTVLRHILAHPTNYRKNEVQLEKRQRKYVPYEKKAPAGTSDVVTSAQKVERALEKARMTETVTEIPLNKALSDAKLRRQYPEADKLLQEVQRKYAMVRVDSTKEAKEVRSAIHSVMRRAARLRDETTSMTGLASLAYHS